MADGTLLVVRCCHQGLTGFPKRVRGECEQLPVPFLDKDMNEEELKQICEHALERLTSHPLYPPKNVVFVCSAGVNRSNLICAYFLAKCCGMTGKGAKQLLVTSKPAWPTLHNRSFEGFVDAL